MAISFVILVGFVILVSVILVVNCTDCSDHTSNLSIIITFYKFYPWARPHIFVGVVYGHHMFNSYLLKMDKWFFKQPKSAQEEMAIYNTN